MMGRRHPSAATEEQILVKRRATSTSTRFGRRQATRGNTSGLESNHVHTHRPSPMTILFTRAGQRIRDFIVPCFRIHHSGAAITFDNERKTLQVHAFSGVFHNLHYISTCRMPRVPMQSVPNVLQLPFPVWAGPCLIILAVAMLHFSLDVKCCHNLLLLLLSLARRISMDTGSAFGVTSASSCVWSEVKNKRRYLLALVSIQVTSQQNNPHPVVCRAYPILTKRPCGGSCEKCNANR